MAYAWMINVLLDLRTFAAENNMPALAVQLDDAKLFLYPSNY
ncbi:MAG: hypothetical protein ACPG4F_13210 [Paracoccaceae bacterium]